MPYRTIVDITDHATIKIKGYENWNNCMGKAPKPMIITGNVDGKTFSVTTSGNNTFGEILEMIVRETK